MAAAAGAGGDWTVVNNRKNNRPQNKKTKENDKKVQTPKKPKFINGKPVVEKKIKNKPKYNLPNAGPQITYQAHMKNTQNSKQPEEKVIYLSELSDVEKENRLKGMKKTLREDKTGEYKKLQEQIIKYNKNSEKVCAYFEKNSVQSLISVSKDLEYYVEFAKILEVIHGKMYQIDNSKQPTFAFYAFKQLGMACPAVAKFGADQLMETRYYLPNALPIVWYICEKLYVNIMKPQYTPEYLWGVVNIVNEILRPKFVVDVVLIVFDYARQHPSEVGNNLIKYLVLA